MISTLLVANRGEIACRVFRTCRERGIGTVAVFSDADAGALHVREADAAVRLPGAAPADTYLRGDLIVKAALAAGADAVHPGYGFLSENAGFARAVLDAGLVWVGPPPEAIEAMASKTRAKELMAAAGVPLLTPVDPASATEADLPLLIKAAAGGGGRGMRVVRSLDAVGEEWEAARAEARSAFGDGEVFAEPYVERGRHVEVQILADAYGTVWALGTRDCSLQRRHQKVIEESPAPGLTAELRATLTDAAVAAARAVEYRGAGTVEFLLSPTGRAYFLEMNTRLQVEHPVTEEVFGVDLVALQLNLADGAPLPPTPPSPLGHAIEARLYAEDPSQDWAPQPGRVHELTVRGVGEAGPPYAAEPRAARPSPATCASGRAELGARAVDPGRIDAPGAVGTGAVGPGASGANEPRVARTAGAGGWAGTGHPGPGASGAGATGPASGGLGRTGADIGGAGGPGPRVAPDAPEPALVGRGGHPRVRVDTGYGSGDSVGVHYDSMLAKVVAWAPTRAEAVRVLAGALRRARVHGPVTNRELLVRSLLHPDFTGGRLDTGFYERHLGALTGPAADDAGRPAAVAAALADAVRRGHPLGGWRNLASQPQTKAYGEYEVRYHRTRDGFRVEDDAVRAVAVTPHRVSLEVDGVLRHFDVAEHGDHVYVDSPAGSYRLRVHPRFTDPRTATAPGSLLAPMPGTVVRIADGLGEGSAVTAGQPLIWLEAMKMEHRITAPASGTLTALHAVPGSQVEVGALLAVVTDTAQEDT
ncbi:biotin carboxylase N-terminal domain-containing protein [Streptomyces sp. IB2014 016-6]|uniref:ATP-binding protein n=1 Tax=Streptomyces sp. IB2014 016-6 TaxID=2517818 RepID=UPI001F4FF941|nr:biotin carboxylase N-terminal domain-containing protein [Streptomyces sp. IB2014 016-6]